MIAFRFDVADDFLINIKHSQQLSHFEQKAKYCGIYTMHAKNSRENGPLESILSGYFEWPDVLCSATSSHPPENRFDVLLGKVKGENFWDTPRKVRTFGRCMRYSKTIVLSRASARKQKKAHRAH
jgi:hypothetical protein